MADEYDFGGFYFYLPEETDQWRRKETILRLLYFPLILDELALDNDAIFDAIKPRVGTYSIYRRGLLDLLLTVKEVANRKQLREIDGAHIPTRLRSQEER